MSPLPVPVLSGRASIDAQQRRKVLFNRKDLYPYSWLQPPPEAERVHVPGSIALPAANTQTLVVSYQVPGNRYFWLVALIQMYVGGNQGSAVLPGDGNIAWSLDVNFAVGVTTPPGYTLQGFGETLSAGKGNFPYGNFQVGLNSPYQLQKPELLEPNDILYSKVTVSATPSGGRLVTILDGWLVPYEI